MTQAMQEFQTTAERLSTTMRALLADMNELQGSLYDGALEEARDQAQNRARREREQDERLGRCTDD